MGFFIANSICGNPVGSSRSMFSLHILKKDQREGKRAEKEERTC
jgi:hypothetical protein